MAQLLYLVGFLLRHEALVAWHVPALPFGGRMGHSVSNTTTAGGGRPVCADQAVWACVLLAEINSSCTALIKREGGGCVNGGLSSHAEMDSVASSGTA